MLSKEGFKHHLDMIDRNTIMAETYKIHHPEVAKRCLAMADESKQILLNHFEETFTKIEHLEEKLEKTVEFYNSKIFD